MKNERPPTSDFLLDRLIEGIVESTLVASDNDILAEARMTSERNPYAERADRLFAAASDNVNVKLQSPDQSTIINLASRRHYKSKAGFEPVAARLRPSWNLRRPLHTSLSLRDDLSILWICAAAVEAACLLASFWTLHALWLPSSWTAFGFAALSFALAASTSFGFAVRVDTERKRAKHKSQGIATAFTKLAEARTRFDLKAHELLSLKSSRVTNLPDAELYNLKELHIAFLEQICSTAVQVLAATSDTPTRFSADIKLIDIVKDKRTGALLPHYSSLVRSCADFKRARYDFWLEKNPIPVRDNAIFRRILNNDFDPNKDYFASPDVERLISIFEQNGEQFVEPSIAVSEKFYQSVLVYPISGRTNLSKQKWLHANGYAIAGMLCVDSPIKGAFCEKEGANVKSNLAVMQQLTDYAFSAIEMFAMTAGNERSASTFGQWKRGLLRYSSEKTCRS